MRQMQSFDTLMVPQQVEDWFSLSRRGDIPPPFVREWLGTVLASHYRLFYAIALGYLKDASFAEDAVQTAAVKGLLNLKNIRRPGSFVSWFAKITRYTCIDFLRHKKRILEDSLDADKGRSAPEPAPFSRVDQQRCLLSEISKLPPSQAIVIQLRFLEDLGSEEIADQLGLKRNAVEVRLHRALAKLAKSNPLKMLRRGRFDET